jgi:hypothetical protein
MDMAFFRRAERMLADRSAARLDYEVLVASLDALQASSPCARAARARQGDAVPVDSEREPLVVLLLGAPGWEQAVPLQGGCFHREPVPVPADDHPNR